MAAIVVLTNVPDGVVARRIADALIERRLAACVNLLAECVSVYRWQGAVETATEVPMLIKTRSELYAEAEAAIRALHPYELPEIIALPVERGCPDFLRWIHTQTVTAQAE
jgi:periplasmic divalent cation tolerance protein